ncbi:MAG: S8 family serine peptidase, partial [Anaerovorax sp.]
MGPANVAIIPVKVLNDEGKGTNYDVVEGIRYAADSGAKIFNMSLGSNYYSRAEAEAIAYAQSKGCVIVAAAGNDGGNVAQSYPASLPGVVAVGASDINNERAYFSNWGDRLDIAAPGVSVLSTIPKKIALKHRASGKVVYGDDAEGYYEEFNGTSMAAPHVAGAVALYKSVNVNASAMDMIEQTFKTAKDIGAIGKDEEFGRGLVDAAAMLGEEVQKTPLMLLAPSSGKELFSHVKFSVQINTNMEIASVDYYLDKLEGTPIVTVPCNQSESIYESVVDTKKIKDGSYQLIAVAKGKDGQQIGEEKSVNITILNQITDGFTLSIKNPLGQGAENAQVQVYGKAGDGTYKALRSVYSTDLGFARIKGVSNNTYETYKVVVNGRFNENNTNEDKSLFVYTKEGITLASEVEMTGAATKPLEFSMEGEVTKNLPNPYIMINPQDIKVGGMAPFKMGPQATIYLEKGEFDVKACWMPDMGVSYDQNEASYYIQKTIRVAENTTGIYIAKGDGTLVNPKFNTKNGRIKLDLQGKNGDPIPFFDGKITGNKIYIAPGTYEARAEITTESDGKITLKKSQDLVVGTDPIALPFEANLAVTKFEPATGALMEDGNTKYMYRGDVLRTEHIIGDTKGNMIENISNVYPVFSVYKIEEGLRTLIYKNSNIFQLNSGYWNSSKDFAGSVQPKTGAYEAELTFNGGEGFGGETKKTMAFELREKSGISQTDVKVTAGTNSVVPAADIELYRWEEGKWVNSLEKIVTDEGGVAHIPENIKLNGEGLNVALVKFDQIKTGYETPQEKHGFQVIPFAKLSDLTSMDVSNTVRVTVNVTDRNGNKPQNLSTPVIVPVYADCGGKLVNKEAVTEVKMNVRQAYGANELYIPAGEYPYIYSEFVLAGQNYYLRAQNFETNAGGTLPLDGKNTSALSLNFAQGLTPDILDMNPGNKMYLSYGKYQI